MIPRKFKQLDEALIHWDQEQAWKMYKEPLIGLNSGINHLTRKRKKHLLLKEEDDDEQKINQ
jgi:hypothetical protein